VHYAKIARDQQLEFESQANDLQKIREALAKSTVTNEVLNEKITQLKNENDNLVRTHKEDLTMDIKIQDQQKRDREVKSID